MNNSINRKCYTMAQVDNDSAEITMYGEIVERQPIDWWTGEPIEGQFIIESEFLEDLEKIANSKNITIRMNSCGGDAGVSILVHNRLRELAREGKNLTCIVDGAAMSGGSLIMCACDNVEVNPSSLIMIHKCWGSLWGGFNADELRSIADSYDAYDKAQVSIYNRKSNLSDTVIMHMMSDTTYMTGREAVEKGFADKLLDDAEPISIAASADGRSIFVRGREMRLAPGMFAPDSIPTVTPEASASDKTNINTPKGGKEMATVQELREKYPEQIAEIEAAVRATVNAADNDAIDSAVNAERKRIEEIDEIGDLFDSDLVNAAKYGENACTAQELALRAAQQAKKQGKRFMADLEDDADESGAEGVPAAPPADDKGEEEDTPEAKMAAARKIVKENLGKEDK